MKLRNQLLALVCLLVFIGFGFVFFHNWVEQKPFGIILFVTDGLSTNTLAATRLYQNGANERLAVESFPHLALLRNASNDYAVPDAAAAATSIATGIKGNNRALAMEPGGKPIVSILALAHDAGRGTGLISTGDLTDPTPAAFYAHATDAKDRQAIAEQLIGSDFVDITLGGGLSNFTPESKGGLRKDGRDLWLELRGKGHSLTRTKAELESTPAFLTTPLTGIFADTDLAFSSQMESGSQQPSLSDMVRRSIQFLQNNRRGYLLVIDAALVSRAAEQNKGERVLSETADFDRAVATALQYAGEKALILCIGKSDLGGLSLNGHPLRDDHGVALLGTNAAGYPALTWSTGPNGPRKNDPSAQSQLSANPTASPSPAATPAAAAESAEPAAFGTAQAIPTARDMIGVATGPGSEGLNGFIDNTEIFKIIQKGL
jgi:alkaline phosphatase